MIFEHMCHQNLGKIAFCGQDHLHCIKSLEMASVKERSLNSVQMRNFKMVEWWQRSPLWWCHHCCWEANYGGFLQEIWKPIYSCLECVMQEMAVVVHYDYTPIYCNGLQICIPDPNFKFSAPLRGVWERSFTIQGWFCGSSVHMTPRTGL